MHIQQLHTSYQSRIRSLEDQLKSTKEEYAAFKHSNNLDEYFQKNLSLETKKRVLKEVEELS